MIRRSTCVAGALCASLVVAPAGAIEVRIGPAAPACAAGQSGFSGEATSAGATIGFSSCARGDGSCRSKIWSASGRVMTEIQVQPPATFRVWMAGIEATDGVTDAQATEIATVVSGAERELASQLLSALGDAGIDPASDASRCLSYHAQAYDDAREQPAAAGTGGDCGGQCNDASTGCAGCCGVGCTGGTGCTTACTWECYLHDDLCGLSLSPGCIGIFVLAAKSMVGCYSLHKKCGRGTGPACECC
jgi:hypothetical protein